LDQSHLGDHRVALPGTRKVWQPRFAGTLIVAELAPEPPVRLAVARAAVKGSGRLVSATEHSFRDAPMAEPIVEGLWGVRYQVADVPRAVAFYTEVLGFRLDFQNLPAFGQVSVGNLKLILSGPGASGSRPMPDGRRQEAGGWNRVVLHVKGLPERIARLRERGVRFRNEMEIGPGGKQIQIEDPDGNPVELFEPAERQ
jgi:glyoxylase I family protein